MRQRFLSELIIVLAVIAGIWVYVQVYDNPLPGWGWLSGGGGQAGLSTPLPEPGTDGAGWPEPAGRHDNAPLKQQFAAAGVAYPPDQVAFLAFKKERVLEVWGKDRGRWGRVTRYPILGASGHLGPKLREGDRQVPEGLYKVLWLNPNSQFHLSMKINYPNAFDMKHAQREGRSEPGSDIFIHGDRVSSGCLAMGDHVIEELYALADDVGVDKIEVIIAPYDMRRYHVLVNLDTLPEWAPELYRRIREALQLFTLPS